MKLRVHTKCLLRSKVLHEYPMEQSLSSLKENLVVILIVLIRLQSIVTENFGIVFHKMLLYNSPKLIQLLKLTLSLPILYSTTHYALGTSDNEGKFTKGENYELIDYTTN